MGETEIIKEPMDFETMSARLNSYHYKTKEMFVYDFNLVVNNCKTYNQVLMRLLLRSYRRSCLSLSLAECGVVWCDVVCVCD